MHAAVGKLQGSPGTPASDVGDDVIELGLARCWPGASHAGIMARNRSLDGGATMFRKLKIPSWTIRALSYLKNANVDSDQSAQGPSLQGATMPGATANETTDSSVWIVSARHHDEETKTPPDTWRHSSHDLAPVVACSRWRSIAMSSTSSVSKMGSMAFSSGSHLRTCSISRTSCRVAFAECKSPGYHQLPSEYNELTRRDGKPRLLYRFIHKTWR